MKYVKVIVVVAFILALTIFIAAEVTELKNADATKPEIISDREMLEIPCGYEEEQLLEGLFASDQEDGDLTSQILVGEISRFIEKGISNVTYIVFDSANQPAVLNRKVKFTDYKSPEFKLSKPLFFSVGQGNVDNLMKMISAVDMLDGDVSQWITRTESNINFQKEGTYQITLETGNQYGDKATVQLPVHICGRISQGIQIELTSPLVYINVGEEVNPLDFISRISSATGEEIDKSKVTVESALKTQTPGTYEIHYSLESGNGISGETWLTVVVRE